MPSAVPAPSCSPGLLGTWGLGWGVGFLGTSRLPADTPQSPGVPGHHLPWAEAPWPQPLGPAAPPAPASLRLRSCLPAGRRSCAAPAGAAARGGGRARSPGLQLSPAWLGAVMLGDRCPAGTIFNFLKMVRHQGLCCPLPPRPLMPPEARHAHVLCAEGVGRACPPQPLGSGLRDPIHPDGPMSKVATWKQAPESPQDVRGAGRAPPGPGGLAG